MSKKTLPDLFADKAAKSGQELGKARGEIIFDNAKNRHYQLFEHGVIIDLADKVGSKPKLVCSYGILFDQWWEKDNAAWLGNPLEDVYETTDRQGITIKVQRFDNGVIWAPNCGRVDGGVGWLSWRDWHAISRQGDDSDKHP